MIHLLVCAGLLLTQDASPDNAELERQVNALVGQLDARQLTERDAAERKLAELGLQALPLLPSIGDDTSPEAAKRLTRLRRDMMRDQALAAAEPARITLRGEKLPLQDVLKAFAEQTGNRVVDHREAFGQRVVPTQVAADFDKEPFWQALDRVLDQAGLTVYGYAGEPGVFLINQPAGSGSRAKRASYDGIFRLEPVRFESQRDLRNEQLGALRFFLEVSWEPRLQPFSLLQRSADVEAVGSGGEVIAPASPQAELESLVRRGFSTAELEIPFQLPPRSIDKVASLKGKIVALVPGPLEEFRFEELPQGRRPKAIEKRKADTVVSLESVTTNNDIWQANVRIRFEAPATALESYRGWMLDNEVYFEDAEGQRIAAGGLEQSLQTRDEIGINYLFDLPDGPGGMTFVYRTPLIVLELPLEYEFRDLKLP